MRVVSTEYNKMMKVTSLNLYSVYHFFYPSSALIILLVGLTSDNNNDIMFAVSLILFLSPFVLLGLSCIIVILGVWELLQLQEV